MLQPDRRNCNFAKFKQGALVIKAVPVKKIRFKNGLTLSKTFRTLLAFFSLLWRGSVQIEISSTVKKLTHSSIVFTYEKVCENFSQQCSA